MARTLADTFSTEHLVESHLRTISSPSFLTRRFLFVFPYRKVYSAPSVQQCGMCNQQSLRSACAYAQSDQSLCLSLEYSMTVKLPTEHQLEFLSLTGGCTGSSESTLVKMPHCWKSHVTAQFIFSNLGRWLPQSYLRQIISNLLSSFRDDLMFSQY